MGETESRHAAGPPTYREAKAGREHEENEGGAVEGRETVNALLRSGSRRRCSRRGSSRRRTGSDRCKKWLTRTPGVRGSMILVEELTDHDQQVREEDIEPDYFIDKPVTPFEWFYLKYSLPLFSSRTLRANRRRYKLKTRMMIYSIMSWRWNPSSR